MSPSIASPCLVVRRYFLSQMSRDAGCKGMSTALSCLTASRRTVLMLCFAPFFTGPGPAPVLVLLWSIAAPPTPCVAVIHIVFVVSVTFGMLRSRPLRLLGISRNPHYLGHIHAGDPKM